MGKHLARCLATAFLFFFTGSHLSAQDSLRYAIIPQPLKLVEKGGEFTINAGTTLFIAGGQAEIKPAMAALVQLIRKTSGYTLSYARRPSGKNMIVCSLDSTIADKEGYRLRVSQSAITIQAAAPAGIFYAIQTLRQLMPPAVERPNSGLKDIPVPAVEIEDAPRFGYSGIMLDVARHFFSIGFIKRYIDVLAFYKINVFHLHLTDDQGWRIEIRKYPKLTSIGAWRKETLVGHRLDSPKVFDGKPHGGFYTQQQLKDLVQYARQRFITIIPEIDLPGHSQAVLAAYPQFGCKDSTYEVATEWGVHKDILCPKEATFRFLEEVLSEVMAIFPSKYIHIGGDEVAKDRWKASAFCQGLIRKYGLKDEHGLQSWFIQRIEKFVNARGRTIIGWDEILEGGLAPNAVVMSWRGEKGGIQAARQHHQVVMTPSHFLYFNWYQTKKGRAIEHLANGYYLPLDKIYHYDPVPSALTAAESAYVIGAQGSLWTEYVDSEENAEEMSFPRSCALAELAWTQPANKNYDSFVRRLKQNSRHLAAMGMKFTSYHLVDLGK
jgi:hexosaminidase